MIFLQTVRPDGAMLIPFIQLRRSLLLVAFQREQLFQLRRSLLFIAFQREQFFQLRRSLLFVAFQREQLFQLRRSGLFVAFQKEQYFSSVGAVCLQHFRKNNILAPQERSVCSILERTIFQLRRSGLFILSIQTNIFHYNRPHILLGIQCTLP